MTNTNQQRFLYIQSILVHLAIDWISDKFFIQIYIIPFINLQILYKPLTSDSLSPLSFSLSSLSFPFSVLLETLSHSVCSLFDSSSSWFACGKGIGATVRVLNCSFLDSSDAEEPRGDFRFNQNNRIASFSSGESIKHDKRRFKFNSTRFFEWTRWLVSTDASPKLFDSMVFDLISFVLWDRIWKLEPLLEPMPHP